MGQVSLFVCAFQALINHGETAALSDCLGFLKFLFSSNMFLLQSCVIDLVTTFALFWTSLVLSKP